jgi:hypothetical protein
MVSFVTRKDGKIYKQRLLNSPLDRLVNNVRLPNLDDDHLYSFLQDSPDGILAPFGDGLIVIDIDSNSIISYQRAFIAGTIKRGEESDYLQEFYDESRVLADQIDYMLDLKPLKQDTYDWSSTGDGKLVQKELQKLGFAFDNNDIVFWDFWFKNVSK